VDTDDVFFDANSGDCNLDVNAVCQSFTTTGYGDIFDVQGFDLFVDGAFTHAGGTMINSGFVEVLGNFTMSATWTDSGGTIDIDATCTWNATLTTTTLELDAIGGTITFTTGNTVTVLENLSIFGTDANDVTITAAGNFTLDLDASISVKFANHVAVDHMQLGAGDTLTIFNGTDNGNNDVDITFTQFDRLTNASGAFDDNAKWDGGNAPVSGDTWEIAAAHTMTIQGTEASADGSVNGTLTFDGQVDSVVAKLTLDGGSVLSISATGTIDTTGTGSTGYAELDTAASFAHLHSEGTYTPGPEFHWSSIHSDITDIGASEKVVIDDALCVFHDGFDIANTGELDAGANNFIVETGQINIDGTFTHTGTITLQGDHTISGTSITLADVNAGTSPGDTIFVDNATISGDLTIGSGDFVTLDGTSNTVTLTFSKTGAQPKIEGPGTLRFTGNGTNYTEIEGNGTYNVLFDTATTLLVDWDFGGSGSKVQLDRCEIDIAVTTGGGGVTITQTGAVIVDATTTITASDAWDTNDVAFTLNVSGNNNGLVLNGTMSFGSSTISLATNTDWWALSIGSGGTLDGETATIESGAVNIGNGATITTTSGNWTVSRSYVDTSLFDAWNVDAGSTPNYASGTLIFTYAGNMSITDAHASTHPYNIIVNHASCVFNPKTNNLIISNDLTITAGELTTTDGTSRDLTVVNITSVSDTLTCNASNCSFNSGGHATIYGISIESGGTFTGGSGAHTFGSILIANTGSMTLTSGVSTIDNTKQNNDICFNLVTGGVFDDGNGTMIFTKAGDQYLNQFGNAPQTFYNVTVNKASGKLRFRNLSGFDLTITNDLTVTAGEFDTSETVSGTSYDLSVTGATSITGTITGNSSAIAFNTCIINNGGTYTATDGNTTMSGAFDLVTGGTLTHSSGTFIWGAAGTINGTGTLEPAFDNLTASDLVTLGNDVTIETALVITAGGDGILITDTFTLTMGTAGAAGSITNNSGTIKTAGASASVSVYGANAGFPCVVTGSDWDWSVNAGATWNLKWLDFQIDIDTATGGANAATLSLDGATEFDAVDVDAADTWDFNSNAGTFGDTFTGAGTIQDTGSAGTFIGNATGTLLATNVIVSNVEAKDGCNIGFQSSTFPTGSVTLNTTGNVVSEDHATVSNVFNLQLTALSFANLPLTPISTDDVTLYSGTWTLGLTADNNICDDLVINAGSTIQVADSVDYYVTTFTLNGTWNRGAGYGGNIHVGGVPFEQGHILDKDIKLDQILDSINRWT